MISESSVSQPTAAVSDERIGRRIEPEIKLYIPLTQSGERGEIARDFILTGIKMSTRGNLLIFEAPPLHSQLFKIQTHIYSLPNKKKLLSQSLLSYYRTIRSCMHKME